MKTTWNTLWNANTSLGTVYDDLTEGLRAAQRIAQSGLDKLAEGYDAHTDSMVGDALQRQDEYIFMRDGLPLL